jgi:hypothetical protein
MDGLTCYGAGTGKGRRMAAYAIRLRAELIVSGFGPFCMREGRIPMRTRIASTMLPLLLVAASLTASRPAEAAVSAPVSGPVANSAGIVVGTFTGTLKFQKFAVQNNRLVLVGALSGTLRNLLGAVIGVVDKVVVTIPVGDVSATCDILHLELGPIDLNLLGLVVHLDRIVLDISAQQGPGNLLGNLLCALVGILDGLSLNDLARVLNSVLALLD